MLTGGIMDTKFQKKHESDMTKKEKRALEREKLASMNGKEKAEYILAYYKLHIAAIFGCILLVAGIAMWIDGFQNETMLYVAVINGRELDAGVMEEFREFREDGERRHLYVLDNSAVSSSQSGSDELDYASQMKIATMVGANTADVFICPESMYQEYSREKNFLSSMEGLLGQEFISSHKEVFEKDAVRVEHSEMLEQYGYQGTEPAYLIVFQYSGHQEVAADFIRFLLSDVDG